MQFVGWILLRLLKQFEIDLIISDISMPKMDGIELLKAIKKNHSEIKIIMLSMLDNHRTVHKVIQKGAHGFVPKFTSKEELQKAVRTLVKFGADHIKIVATGGILSSGDAVDHPQYSDEELRAVVEEAGRLGRKVIAHAHGAEGLKAAVRAGVASIEHGSLVDAEGIELMKERGAFIVPTLLILDEIIEFGEERGIPEYSIQKAIEMSDLRETALRKAYQEGVRFAFGTDASGNLHGRNAQEFEVMIETLGARPMQVIQNATYDAAELLGILDQVGTLEVGKWADIIAVAGNPLEDITLLETVNFVMKAGEIYKHLDK